MGSVLSRIGLSKVLRNSTPISFFSVNASGKPGHNPQLQRHHLLPLQLLSTRVFGRMFSCIGRARIGFDDFRANGMLLPAKEAMSVKLGLPLHRGPHRLYSEMVMGRVGRIEESWSSAVAADPEAAMEEALLRLGLLQAALRRRLLDERRRILLNTRDPLGKGYDFGELDAMAETLWHAN